MLGGSLLTLLALSPAELRLEWRAPEDACPDRTWIEARVLALAGADATSTELQVQAAVRPDPRTAEWLGELSSVAITGGARRTLRGSSCAEVAEAVAVVIAMALGEARGVGAPRGAEPRGEAPRSPEGPAPRAARSESAARSPREPPSTPAPRGGEAAPVPLRFDLGLELHSALGTLPDPSAGIGLRGALGLGTGIPLRVELGLQAFLPSRAVVREAPEAGGAFVLAGGELRLCALPWSVGRLTLGLCAGGELDLLWARGFGVSAPIRAFELIPRLDGELLALWAIGEALGLSLRLGASLPVVRPMFTLNPLGEVHQVAPIAGRLALGLEFGLF